MKYQVGAAAAVVFIAVNTGKWTVFSMMIAEPRQASVVFGAAAGLFFAAALPGMWLAGRAQAGLFFVLSLLTTLLLYIDLLYSRFYTGLPSIAEANFTIVTLTALVPTAVSLAKAKDLFWWLDILLWLIVLRGRDYSGVPRIDLFRRQIIIRRIAVSLAIIVASGCLALPAGKLAKQDYLRRYKVFEVDGSPAMVSSIGAVGYHIYDLFLNWHARREVAPDEIAEVKRFFAGRDLELSGSTSIIADQTKPMNIIMVLGESWLGFTLGHKIGGQAVTPNLNRLAERSIVSGMMYDVSGSGGTSDAEFAVLNSLLPLNNEPIPYRYQSNTFRALPEILAEQGYRTIMATVANPELWNMRRIHARYGFEELYFESDWSGAAKMSPWGIGDREFFELAMEKISSSDASDTRPFFALLIPSTSHYPFVIADAEKSLDLADVQVPILRDYFHAINYFDRAVGRLLELLKERDMESGTMICVFGDHAAGMREELHDYLGLARSDRAGSRLVTMTGLIIASPEQPGIPSMDLGVTGRVGSIVDIAPTILSLRGTPGSARWMLGNSLLNRDTNIVVHPRGIASNGEYLVVPGFTVPEGFGCWSYEKSSFVRPHFCDGLAQDAAIRNRVSRNVIWGDLFAGKVG